MEKTADPAAREIGIRIARRRETLGMTQSAISHQLRLLKQARLVSGRIYVSTLWTSELLSPSGNAFEHSMSDNAVFLPIDQRYGDDDIAFMKSIVLNMKDAVRIDFEKVLESYTMAQEDPFEHFMILCTSNTYVMLYWSTTA